MDETQTVCVAKRRRACCQQPNNCRHCLYLSTSSPSTARHGVSLRSSSALVLITWLQVVVVCLCTCYVGAFDFAPPWRMVLGKQSAGAGNLAGGRSSRCSGRPSGGEGTFSPEVVAAAVAYKSGSGWVSRAGGGGGSTPIISTADVTRTLGGVGLAMAASLAPPVPGSLPLPGNVYGVNDMELNDYDDAASAYMPPKQLKVGVLLLNLGGPEKAEDVEGFLYNLFADPDIIRLPPLLNIIQAPLARFLSSRRAPKSRAAYEAIGGGSPIVRYTKAQGRGIEERLRAKGLKGAKAYVAMRYWHPFTEQALEEMEEDGINAIVVLPLYPQFSISTSGSSLRVLRERFLQNERVWGPKKVRHTVIPAWYDRPGYVKAVGGLIRKELQSYTEEQKKEGLHVLFSAHGVPKSYIEVGDPYQAHIEECVTLIRKQYEKDMGDFVQTHLSYQSRVGPIEWLQPYTEDVIPKLGAQGVKNLVVVPISFVSEHIETLEEIDMEYKELAEENGITAWKRVPALNTDGAFLDDLANLCVEALAQPSISIAEACMQNNVDLESDPLADALSNSIRRNQLLTSVALGSLLLDMVFGKGVAYLLGVL